MALISLVLRRPYTVVAMVILVTLLGIGAAFDLNTGRLVQAPRWMRENGLEWLFRLIAEPKRLWKRYLILIPKFLGNVVLELLGLRKYY